jgi:hypothetical protein
LTCAKGICIELIFSSGVMIGDPPVYFRSSYAGLTRISIVLIFQVMNAFSQIKYLSLPFLGALVLCALASPATADQVSREQDITDLRLGQRMRVDDGSCPPGEIKEISGAKMTATGVLRVQKCVPRLGAKK